MDFNSLQPKSLLLLEQQPAGKVSMHRVGNGRMMYHII